jgi:hypothetical protein
VTGALGEEEKVRKLGGVWGVEVELRVWCDRVKYGMADMQGD